jgi:hypothetical protein
VFRLSIGEAFAAAFAYRRAEPLPSTPDDLRAAERRLVQAVRRRDHGFRLIDAHVTRVAAAPAIELVGDQTLSRTRLRTRSVHVFKGQVEYVLDMAAPVASFRTTNRRSFRRMVRSLRVTGTFRGARR